ncbi:MAG: YqgE/AlgH family protein [Caulobacterales bacterium]
MQDSLEGKLLVAMPGMGDPRFAHAVIVMCSHSRNEAMGIIINKPKDALTLGDVLQHLGIEAKAHAPRTVMDGGPVKPDRGYVLHSRDFTAPNATIEITGDVSMTATREVLEAIGGDGAPQQFLLALGCSGWGAGQLEDELRQNAWLIVEPDDAIIFGAEHEDKWERAIHKLGLDPAQLTAAAGRA